MSGCKKHAAPNILLQHGVKHGASPADGAPLSELSWSSSLAVVAISFSGLFTFVFLMLACLCCKKGKMGFKVGKNARKLTEERNLNENICSTFLK